MAEGITAERSYLITPEGHRARIYTALIIWASGLPLTILTLLLLFRNWYWACFIGAALWVVVVGYGVMRKIFVVSVPEVTGAILQNLWVRVTNNDPYANQTVFPQGWWFKYPWEQVKEGMYINLRIVQQDYTEDAPAADGPKVFYRGGFIYRPLLSLLPRYVAVDDTVINQGLVDLTTSLLSRLIAEGTAAEARESIDIYQIALVDMFNDPLSALRMADARERHLLEDIMHLPPTFGNLFGIDFLAAVVGDVDYEDAYQTSLSKRAQSDLIEQVRRRLALTMSAENASDTALVQFGIVKRETFRLDGEAHQALAALLARIGGIGR